MKKVFWSLITSLVIFVGYVAWYHADWLVIPPFEHVAAQECNTKCDQPPNPNRPFFDTWSNEFSYDGTLLKANCPTYIDPISKQPNPKCQCPTNTTDGVYYLQGYDKDTGAAVCGFSYYHACPYADAVTDSSEVCQKLSTDLHPQDQINTPQGFTGK